MENVKDCYFILTAGFWSQSGKGNIWFRKVDPELDSTSGSVDYIIKVKGVPEEYIKPEYMEPRYKYYCDQCERYVSEGEIQHRWGCALHKYRTEKIDKPYFKLGAFEPYTIDKMKWMDPCYRIWFDSIQGVERWMKLWNFIRTSLPPTEVPQDPKLVGTRRAWLISPDEVPEIDLTKTRKEEPTQVGIGVGIYKCEECGKEFDQPNKLKGHIRFAHKKKTEVTK